MRASDQGERHRCIVYICAPSTSPAAPVPDRFDSQCCCVAELLFFRKSARRLGAGAIQAASRDVAFGLLDVNATDANPLCAMPEISTGL